MDAQLGGDESPQSKSGHSQIPVAIWGFRRTGCDDEQQMDARFGAERKEPLDVRRSGSAMHPVGLEPTTLGSEVVLEPNAEKPENHLFLGSETDCTQRCKGWQIDAKPREN